jgi:peptide/nickel transport system permease protein
MHRLNYLARKAVFSLITLILIFVFNFYLFRIIPGDPIQLIINPRMQPETKEKIRQELGLDKPIWFNLQAAQETDQALQVFDSQFFRYLGLLARGSLGESLRQQRPVSELIASRLGPTLLLLFAGELMGILLGGTLGLLAAWKKKSLVDYSALILGLTAWSMPAFWFGILLLTMARGVLPMGGMQTAGMQYANFYEYALDVARHMILPTITLGVLLFGSYLLVTRNASLDVLAEDHILTAKAKGFNPPSVLRHHALKNAALPLVTIIALDLGFALGGMIQIETIFSWPGVGRLMFDAIAQRDYPVLQGVFLMLAIGVILANFIADFTYVLLDPRVKS